jgi:hypothetical protein
MSEPAENAALFERYHGELAGQWVFPSPARKPQPKNPKNFIAEECRGRKQFSQQKFSA